MQTYNTCKICRSPKLITVKTYTVDEQLDPYWESAIKRLKLTTPFSIRLAVCRQCGFLFYRDTFSYSQMKRLYQEEARYAKPTEHQLKSGRLWELNSMHTFLKQSLPKKQIRRVLDVGAGDFVALEKIVALHPQATYHAVDPSYPKASHKGIKVYKTMIEDWKTSSQYDLVLLIHVLEHVGGVSMFMEKVSRLIKKGGYLYIEVPFQVGPGLFLNRSANVQHVNYFTPQSMTNLLARHGVTVTNLEFDTTAYTKNGMPGMIRILSKKEQKTGPRNSFVATLANLANPLPILQSAVGRR